MSISHVLRLPFPHSYKGWAPRTLHCPALGKGKEPSETLKMTMQGWQCQRTCCGAPMSRDVPALLGNHRNQESSCEHKCHLPTLCSQGRHLRKKLSYEDPALGVSVKNHRQAQEACEKLVLSRKWGHLVASYENVQDYLGFPAQKPNWENSH